MVLNIRMSQDMLAGVIFMAIGAAAYWFGSDLDTGNAADMGAGYVPHALAGIIFGMGAFMSLRSIWLSSPAVGSVNLRPIVFVLASCAAFALLLMKSDSCSPARYRYSSRCLECGVPALAT